MYDGEFDILGGETAVGLASRLDIAPTGRGLGHRRVYPEPTAFGQHDGNAPIEIAPLYRARAIEVDYREQFARAHHAQPGGEATSEICPPQALSGGAISEVPTPDNRTNRKTPPPLTYGGTSTSGLYGGTPTHGIYGGTPIPGLYGPVYGGLTSFEPTAPILPISGGATTLTAHNMGYGVGPQEFTWLSPDGRTRLQSGGRPREPPRKKRGRPRDSKPLYAFRVDRQIADQAAHMYQFPATNPGRPKGTRMDIRGPPTNGVGSPNGVENAQDDSPQQMSPSRSFGNYPVEEGLGWAQHPPQPSPQSPQLPPPFQKSNYGFPPRPPYYAPSQNSAAPGSVAHSGTSAALSLPFPSGPGPQFAATMAHPPPTVPSAPITGPKYYVGGGRWVVPPQFMAEPPIAAPAPVPSGPAPTARPAPLAAAAPIVPTLIPVPTSAPQLTAKPPTVPHAPFLPSTSAPIASPTPPIVPPGPARIDTPIPSSTLAPIRPTPARSSTGPVPTSRSSTLWPHPIPAPVAPPKPSPANVQIPELATQREGEHLPRLPKNYYFSEWR